MSDTITLTLACCDDFLNGKRAIIEYTYIEAGTGYMGGWCSARVELDAVVVGSGEYLDSLDKEDQKALAQRVLEAIEEDWSESEADRQMDASLTDHYLACTKGY